MEPKAPLWRNTRLTNLVQRISVGAHNLIAIFRPCQITNLTAGIDAVDTGPREAIPKSNASVGGSSSAGEKAVLMRRPRDRFDGGGVIGKGVNGLSVFFDVPDEKLVVVSPARQHVSFVEGPLEPAHFLLVRAQPRFVRSLRPGVAQMNETIPAPRSQKAGSSRSSGGCFPRKGADACRVSFHGTDEFASGGIPELNVPSGGPDGEMLAGLRPGDGSDSVFGGGQVAQLGDAAGARRPEVDAASETDRQKVLGGPIDEVEVEVVLERGCVQNLGRHLGDLSFALIVVGT